MRGLKLAALGTFLALRFITAKTYDFKQDLNDKKNGTYEKEISIIGNQFTDFDENILKEHFTDVRNFTISSNSFQSIPAILGELKDLKRFTFECDNPSTDFSNILKMENLILLKYSNKHLTQLPDNFGYGNLANLEELELTSCNLTKLPDTLGKLMNLRKLTLQDNKSITFSDSFNTS